MTTVTHTKEYNATTLSSEDFPVLGTMAPEKKKNSCSIKKNGKKNGKKNVIDISHQLGFISRMDVLKANRHYRRERFRGERFRGDDEKRAAAYEQLQDKEAMAKRLTKTRLCWSVQKGVVCPHGDGNCQFAHTKDELRMAPCLFGDRCRFVRWQNNEYVNTPSNCKCHYVHPEENRENYLKRTGLDKIEIKTPAKTTDIVPVQVLTKSRWIPPRLKEKEERLKANSEQIALLDDKNPCTLTEESDEVEVLSSLFSSLTLENELLDSKYATYTIPKKLALETLKAALEAGQTKITLTII